jgi:hypothetical protein
VAGSEYLYLDGVGAEAMIQDLRSCAVCVDSGGCVKQEVSGNQRPCRTESVWRVQDFFKGSK